MRLPIFGQWKACRARVHSAAHSALAHGSELLIAVAVARRRRVQRGKVRGASSGIPQAAQKGRQQRYSV